MNVHKIVALTLVLIHGLLSELNHQVAGVGCKRLMAASGVDKARLLRETWLNSYIEAFGNDDATFRLTEHLLASDVHFLDSAVEELV